MGAYYDGVFVANQYNNCVSVFQCDGQFGNSFGSDQLSSPLNVNNNQLLNTNWVITAFPSLLLMVTM